VLVVATSLKARVALSLCYACGLRAGEAVRLKVKYIDSAQKIIRIEQSKGRKDRNVMLPAETLNLLRQWWKARRSRYDAGIPLEERWLFPGVKPGRPMVTYEVLCQGVRGRYSSGFCEDSQRSTPQCRRVRRSRVYRMLFG